MEHNKHERGKAPEITTAEDILAKLRHGVKAVYEIEMRGAVIPVRILSIDEMNKIRQQATKDMMLSQGDETDKNLFIQRSTLKLATTIPVGSAPYLGDKVLSMLSVDEVTYLFEQYMGVMARVNPSLETITDDQFKALVDALKKKHISTRDLSLRQLRGICEHFVDVILKQETAI